MAHDIAQDLELADLPAPLQMAARLSARAISDVFDLDDQDRRLVQKIVEANIRHVLIEEAKKLLSEQRFVLEGDGTDGPRS